MLSAQFMPKSVAPGAYILGVGQKAGFRLIVKIFGTAAGPAQISGSEGSMVDRAEREFVSRS